MVQKADISPAACIGPGLYIPHTVGIIFYGHAGHSLTLFAKSVVVPGSMQPFFGGQLVDVPRLGDGVTLGTDVVVVGAVQIGNGVRVGPGVVVRRDVDEGSTLLPLYSQR